MATAKEPIGKGDAQFKIWFKSFKLAMAQQEPLYVGHDFRDRLMNVHAHVLYANGLSAQKAASTILDPHGLKQQQYA